MGDDRLIVGADARPITPDLSTDTVFLAGFDMDRPATAVHDDLMVRTVAISDGDGEPIVLSVCDLIGLTRVHSDKGRRVVACTHTHHGPDGLGFWGKPFEGVTGIDHAYLQRVRGIVAESQAAAVAAMEPASIMAGSVAVPELVKNLRNPTVLDDELSVVRAVRDDGSVVATLLGYACHPEVVAADGTDVTADFPGHLCRSVEATVGGVAVFAVGALGGMQSPDTEVNTHEEAERFGRVLAEAAERALVGVDADPAPTLGFGRAEVVFRLENPLYTMGMELGLVPQAELRGEDGVSEVSLIRIGPAMLASVPGELFPELGLQLKASMRAAGATVPVVVGLADDELGYLVPAEDFVYPADYLDPGKQYEESFSAGPTVAPAVTAALTALIAQVAAP